MKLSTLIVLGIVGLLVYSVFNFNSQRAGQAAAQADATPAPTTPVQGPLPEVHVTSLTIIRGQVVDSNAAGLVVNCDYVAKLSPSAQAKWRQIANDAGDIVKGLPQMAQAEADRTTFGPLQALGKNGQMQIASSTPQHRATGKVILQGLPVRNGGMVHIVAAPITSIAGFPTYTVRFNVMGGSWMWNDRRSRLVP
jgi:hypothetical protein